MAGDRLAGESSGGRCPFDSCPLDYPGHRLSLPGQIQFAQKLLHASGGAVTIATPAFACVTTNQHPTLFVSLMKAACPKAVLVYVTVNRFGSLGCA